MDVHPSGDHLIVGGYDRKLTWFDMDLSDKPYKVLKYVFLPMLATLFNELEHGSHSCFVTISLWRCLIVDITHVLFAPSPSTPNTHCLPPLQTTGRFRSSTAECSATIQRILLSCLSRSSKGTLLPKDWVFWRSNGARIGHGWLALVRMERLLYGVISV